MRLADAGRAPSFLGVLVYGGGTRTIGALEERIAAGTMAEVVPEGTTGAIAGRLLPPCIQLCDQGSLEAIRHRWLCQTASSVRGLVY